MATITSSPLLTCQGCGKETRRLFGEGPFGADHCAVCHLEDLATDEHEACVVLDMIADIVRSAARHTSAHPDDIREKVENARWFPRGEEPWAEEPPASV